MGVLEKYLMEKEGVKLCPYCSAKYGTGEMCATCYGKRGRVHELWLLCQEIKQIIEGDKNEGNEQTILSKEGDR